MTKPVIYIFVALFSLIFISCSPKHSEIIVAEYGDYKIPMGEFEQAYAKNVGSIEEAKKDSIDEFNKFLDLYVNFKMKLRDAKIRNLEEDPALVSELESYKKSIGVSYLLEKELIEKGLKELYDKRKEELRVSHLLIRTDKVTDEEAKAKATEILDRIKNGSSFEDEVKQYSEDSFSKSKGGDIYYITAGNILPSFEDLAYETKVGTVNPNLLKTQFGYHILKVTDRRERIPKVQASHILIAKSKDGNDSLNTAALNKAKDILERIKKGEKFEALAMEFSEDPGSKVNGGDLGYFTRRQMVQPFDEAVFNLKVGEVSDIVETNFGYHIIKLTAVEKYPTYEVEKKEIRDIYEKTRRKDDYKKLVDKYSMDLNVVTNDLNLKELISESDSTTLNQSYWESDLHTKLGSKNIVTIGKTSFNIDSLFAYTLSDPKNTNSQLNEKSIGTYFEKFKEDKTIENAAAKVLATDDKFNNLMNDYKSGILIFKLQENEIWNKMEMDSVGIAKLYNETKDSYVLPNRVQFSEIFANSDSLINSYLAEIKSGVSFDSLLIKKGSKIRTETSPYKNELKEVGDNKYAIVAFNLKNIGDYSEIIKDPKGSSILKLINKEVSRIKTFDEARPEVTSAYQDIESAQLENNYIGRLKRTYEPKLFYNELQKAFKN